MCEFSIFFSESTSIICMVSFGKLLNELCKIYAASIILNGLTSCEISTILTMSTKLDDFL